MKYVLLISLIFCWNKILCQDFESISNEILKEQLKSRKKNHIFDEDLKYFHYIRKKLVKKKGIDLSNSFYIIEFVYSNSYNRYHGKIWNDSVEICYSYFEGDFDFNNWWCSDFMVDNYDVEKWDFNKVIEENKKLREIKWLGGEVKYYIFVTKIEKGNKITCKFLIL
ncbi:hypothetical protein [Flammeovirga pacifica]|uniref:Uncharacterized protein n=1 Tax=Flammeovirga pacifica TaxID=915059 RepID=A0A1S1YXQ1_FLAPC|nr:hypothetical protein [Flammeovirga pacifica]OHX65786.1 hypothetical protein NH26_05190 [Flammeovirga pacifica]